MMGAEQQHMPRNLDSIGMISDNILANISTFLVILAAFIIFIAALFVLMCIK
jgi:hypothetical protein